ncbi:NAD(P)H azoreductase [Streptomyces sp. 769]|nr:NAD(P)H azoreductase [Streptomyces sp. 769]
MDHALGDGAVDTDVMAFPQLGELTALPREFRYELSDSRIVGVPSGPPEVGDAAAAQSRPVARADPGGRAGEQPAQGVPFVLRQLREVRDQRVQHAVPGEDVVTGVEHHGRHGVELVQQAPRTGVGGPRHRHRHGGLADQPQQVVAFAVGEVQRPGQGDHDLPGGPEPAPLFQPGVVVQRNPGALGDLRTAQPPRLPPPTAGQPHVRRPDARTTGTEESGQLCRVHSPRMPDHGAHRPTRPPLCGPVPTPPGRTPRPLPYTAPPRKTAAVLTKAKGVVVTILVTGGRGHVARSVVDGLLATGARVRVASRSPERVVVPAGVETVRADLADPRTLPAEEALRHSRLAWTFLRPGAFATNTLQWAPAIRASGTVRAPYPQAHAASVHEDHIADVAVLALTRDGHQGLTHPLTGPASVTQQEQIDCLAAATGRKIRLAEIGTEEYRATLRQWGDEEMVDTLLTHLAEADNRPAAVCSTYRDLTGGPGRSYAQWALDHAADFR